MVLVMETGEGEGSTINTGLMNEFKAFKKIYNNKKNADSEVRGMRGVYN